MANAKKVRVYGNNDRSYTVDDADTIAVSDGILFVKKSDGSFTSTRQVFAAGAWKHAKVLGAEEE